MKENFLHFLWRTRRFDMSDLKTTSGEVLEILNFGEYNHDAGADFQQARIKIGDLLWVGSVEIHVKSSDWHLHRHNTEGGYKNVVLHVVYENDRDVVRDGGEKIPCLVLRERIPEGIFKKYHTLLHSEKWIPCQNLFFEVSDLVKNSCYERLLIERLERKTTAIAQQLERNKGDWEETFWQFLARNFGFKVNAEPMEMLARSLPQLILAKHKNQLPQIEALLLGQAGFLENRSFTDEYPVFLQKEYNFLKNKHNLTPLDSAIWKFSRMRPYNFPTIRLVQLAGLVSKSSRLFSRILDAENAADLIALFEVEVSYFWKTHFNFDNPSVQSEKKIGADTIELLIINTIAPFLFIYGVLRADDTYKNRALNFLEALHPEKNTIVSGWQKLGVAPESAARTQALIELKNEYCTAKRCTECAIGGAILKK